MKKLFLFLCVCFFCHLAHSQWTTSGSDIYYTTGSVSINATTPLEKLTINGNALADKFRLNRISTPGIGCGLFCPAGAMVGVYTNSLERMRVDSNGNVCIGGTTPLEMLTISGNALADKFRLNRLSTPGVGCGIFCPAGSVYGVYTSNHERMRVDSSGNVLIGKTSQTNTGYILDVNGSARATSVVVNTTGADYVFGNAYSLPSLKKVEKYIDEHHHLPGIAPAEQMQKQGMDLGDNQTRLLAKIEELTLYVIAQSRQQEKETKQIKELQDKIRQLQQQQSKKLHQ